MSASPPARRSGLRDHAAGKLAPTPFDEKLERTYHELWHHEGRCARMGTARMGPDYTQWHGFYEVAKHFYSELLSEADRRREDHG